MGQFPTNPGYITRAQTWIPTNNINPKSAWLFENQSGTLGTNLTGSVVYVGTAGTVKVIVSGTSSNTISGSVLTLELTSAGTGYTAGATNIPITGISTSSEGLVILIDTVNGGGGLTAFTIEEAGKGYTVGQTFTVPGGDNNATFRINKVSPTTPVASQALEFKNVAAGTILPVVVDYVLVPSNGNAASDIIVGK
jgi:hypothetical protein